MYLKGGCASTCGSERCYALSFEKKNIKYVYSVTIFFKRGYSLMKILHKLCALKITRWNLIVICNARALIYKSKCWTNKTQWSLTNQWKQKQTYFQQIPIKYVLSSMHWEQESAHVQTQSGLRATEQMNRKDGTRRSVLSVSALRTILISSSSLPLHNPPPRTIIHQKSLWTGWLSTCTGGKVMRMTRFEQTIDRYS